MRGLYEKEIKLNELTDKIGEWRGLQKNKDFEKIEEAPEVENHH